MIHYHKLNTIPLKTKIVSSKFCGLFLAVARTTEVLHIYSLFIVTEMLLIICYYDKVTGFFLFQFW